MNCVRMTACAGAIALAAAATANADVTFRFDPNNLLDLFPAVAGDEDVDGENKVSQINGRRVHAVWGNTFYETFYNPASPHTQPDDYNTYRNWLDSLGSGEGISAFNIWLLDNPAARSWGEQVVWDPDGDAPTGTGDAAGNWNVDVIENPWGPGWLVQWWTEDADYMLRPGGADIGEFSFAGKAFWDLDEDGFDGDDAEVEVGDETRIWFGSFWGARPDHWDPNEHSMAFDDVGFGDRTPNLGTFQPPDGDVGGNVGWEGTLQITTVPAPGAALLGMIGLGTIGWVRRRV